MSYKHLFMTSLHRTLPAHVLSVLLIVIGIIGFTLHLLHARSRRKLWLTSPPGSIASIVSLTSRSGFGELLLPYDDEQRMRANLSGLAFHLDPRTGAVVAEEQPGVGGEGVTLLSGGDAYRSAGWTDGFTPLSATSFKVNEKS